MPPSCVEECRKRRRPSASGANPAVALGDLITIGDSLGTVCDMLGETFETIVSQHDGIVLTLKTFGRVWPGEMVGVILETGLSAKND